MASTPAALRALEAYREHAYPELASDLDTWIRAIVTGPTVRGGVGARNEAHLASRPKARPASSARPKPKGKAKPKAGKKRPAKKAVKGKGKRRS